MTTHAELVAAVEKARESCAPMVRARHAHLDTLEAILDQAICWDDREFPTRYLYKVVADALRKMGCDV